jgi:M3 family oligoendopeptidase
MLGQSMSAVMQSTFPELQYKRPDLEALTKLFDDVLAPFEQATSAQEQLHLLDILLPARNSFSTMYNLCYIRHTLDTTDPFYEAENTYFDQHIPHYEALNNRLANALLHSPFQEELEATLGKQLFTLTKLALKTFHPSILQLLGTENELSSEYTRLKAQASIDFEGTSYNLSSIYPLELSDNRDLRKRASIAKWSFYQEKEAEIDHIFDQMVKTRHEIATKLGFANFIEVGYARMRRSDYTPEMVANFRKQVRELIVPIATSLYERQQKRLQLNQLNWYDEEYKFTTGNPKPIGSPEEIVAKAAHMYAELSPETNAFFQYMQNNQLMDLVNRAGKAPGGYCTYLTDFKSPYIFSNFNGTSGDIDVLTHEAGHAFQVWLSGQRFKYEEYHWPTSEAAEIHSMSMEFLTWPWMHLFFGEQTEKYHFMHLANAIQFIPYGVAIDEFQHLIYQYPTLSPQERHEIWRGLEKIYLPHRQYEGMPFLEKGGFWQKQSHVFNNPFYYIDYTLAQICAFQFWVKDRNDHPTAWADYLRLCQAGGSLSFLQLVQLANLKSPFEEGCIASVIEEINQFLNQVDDHQF